MSEPTITAEELAELERIWPRPYVTVPRLIAALRAKDEQIEELAQAVRLADQEADEIIDEMGREIAVLRSEAEQLRAKLRAKCELPHVVGTYTTGSGT